jgi:hypothetical protein
VSKPYAKMSTPKGGMIDSQHIGLSAAGLSARRTTRSSVYTAADARRCVCSSAGRRSKFSMIIAKYDNSDGRCNFDLCVHFPAPAYTPCANAKCICIMSIVFSCACECVCEDASKLSIHLNLKSDSDWVADLAVDSSLRREQRQQRETTSVTSPKKCGRNARLPSKVTLGKEKLEETSCRTIMKFRAQSDCFRRRGSSGH